MSKNKENVGFKTKAISVKSIHTTIIQSQENTVLGKKG